MPPWNQRATLRTRDVRGAGGSSAPPEPGADGLVDPLQDPLLGPRTPLGPKRDRRGLGGAVKEGLSDSAQPLPELDRIQRSFGAHDVSGVRAHLGSKARAVNETLDSNAFTTGEDVVLDPGGADLHTLAHEAAHVVQQRAGARPPGGVGHGGGALEAQADQVAERVVAGESAEELLDQVAQGG